MNKLAKLSLLPFAFVTQSAFALEALDDQELSTMTGQAGVTIELEVLAQIGELSWTDTDTGGSLHIGNVALGGNGLVGGSGGNVLDNIKLTIDSDEYGNLIVGHTALDQVGMLDGSNAIDIGLNVGYIGISGNAGYSQLISDVNLSGVIGPGDAVIFNDGSSGLIQTQGYSEIVDGSAMLDVLGVGIKDLRIYQDSNPFSKATYTDADGNEVAKWYDYNTDLLVDADGDGIYEASAAQYATDNGNTNWAFGAATIGTTAINGGADQALYLRIDHSVVDISMTMGIGGGSYDNIGQINIQDLSTTGTELIIYGH